MGSVWNSLPQGKRSCSDEFVRGVYAPWFLSHHNKDLEWWTLKPPRHVTALGSWTDCVIAHRVIALRQISVTALFYLEDSRKICLWGVRAHLSKDVKRRAPQSESVSASKQESPLAPLFICFFLPPGPALCKLGLVRSPHSSPWTFLCSIFVGFSLSYLLAFTILDSFSLF